MNTNRDKRLSEIERLLLANPQGLKAIEIANALKVNRSTISRDLVGLERIGVLLWENEVGRLGLFRHKSQVTENSVGKKYNEPIGQMQTLLASRDCEEAKYQKLFQDHPWMLGVHYKEIRRHRKLDDENIPDFVGVRVIDNMMDIFEIKPPFYENTVKQRGIFCRF